MEPTAYFHREGPIGELTTTLHERRGAVRAGVVGLGIGAMACHQVAGEAWDFYEIDPLVVYFAQESGFFSYLRDCLGERRIVLGDARQTLAASDALDYDFLLIDAFSSDAIPIHLITLEAVKLYISTLKQDGVLAIHISNRYLDLVPILTAIAKTLGLQGKWIYLRNEAPEGEDQYAPFRSPVMVAILGQGSTLDELELPSEWLPMDTDASKSTPWTDERSSVLEAFK